MQKKNVNMPKWLTQGIKLFLILWALSSESLTVLEWGYEVDIPVIKWVFQCFKSIDGWGLDTMFMAVGMGVVLYHIHNHPRQKSISLSVLSAFFAVSTVFGKSYYEIGSWDYIFHGKVQFGLAVVVMCGFYFAYKNGIIMIGYLLEKTPSLFRKDVINKVERCLFERHAFLLPFLIIMVLGLPVLIVFWPGPLHADAFAHLWQYYGVTPINDMSPIAVTKLMGKVMDIGKQLFGSDNVGLFLYNGGQFVVQALIFAYSFCVLKRMKASVALRWITLVWYTILPIFPVWGYTLTKDTGYYLCIYLFILAIIDGICDRDAGMKWWRFALLFTGSIGASLFRNNGKYIVLATLIVMIIAYRKYWKQYVAVLASCVVILFVFEHVYIPAKGYAEGPVKEALSIPLQMTARYLKEHMDEVTQEEYDVLSGMFTTSLEEVAQSYHPEVSDYVKGYFADYPASEDMDSYMEVFWQQFVKHPDTYMQAFLNHTYGYFYPERENFWDAIGIFRLLGRQTLEMEAVNVSFVEAFQEGRDFFEEYTYLVERMPVIGMIYSAGLHIYILLGMFTYLISRRKGLGLAVLLPSLCMILCIASPVNAYFRYVMPLVVTLPVNVAWCHYIGGAKEELG